MADFVPAVRIEKVTSAGSRAILVPERAGDSEGIRVHRGMLRRTYPRP
ncbi:hypothetical protein RKD19_004328 [Streptomyces canus]